jgi:methylmalonyl-CoA mutase N-terminal domain/subunit
LALLNSNLKKMKAERIFDHPDPYGIALRQALDRLRIACEGTENTMPRLLDAVRAYATLGEIMDVMKEVFGVYAEPTSI